MLTLEMGGNFWADMFSTYQLGEREREIQKRKSFQAGNQPGGRW